MGWLSELFGNFFSKKDYNADEALQYVKKNFRRFGKRVAPEDRKDFEKIFLKIAKQQVKDIGPLSTKEINLLVNRTRIRLSSSPRVVKGAERYKERAIKFKEFQKQTNRIFLALDLKFQHFFYQKKDIRENKIAMFGSKKARFDTLHTTAQNILNDVTKLIRVTKEIQGYFPDLADVMTNEIARWSELVHMIDDFSKNNVREEELQTFLIQFQKKSKKTSKTIKARFNKEDKVLAA